MTGKVICLLSPFGTLKGSKMCKYLVIVAGLIFASTAIAEKPVLTVYAPDYFGSEWGPGPSIETAFEQRWGKADACGLNKHS